MVCNGACTSSVVSCSGSVQCATWNFDSSSGGWQRVPGTGALQVDPPQPATAPNGHTALALKPQDSPVTQVGVWVAPCGTAISLKNGTHIAANIYVAAGSSSPFVYLTIDSGEIDNSLALADLTPGGWTAVSLTVPFDVLTVHLGLDVYNGVGTVFIDDVKLLQP
jgi:hypothetical protein